MSCTLTYTLLEGAPITIEQLHLILRTLHTFKVKSITKLINYCTVELEYQANVSNCRSKLGSLADWIAITKVAGDITPDEIPILEALRAKFGFGQSVEEESEPAAIAPPKRKYKRSNKTLA